MTDRVPPPSPPRFDDAAIARACAAHRKAMAADGQPETAITSFLAALRAYLRGDKTEIAERDIEPAGALVSADELVADPTLQRLGAEALDRVAVIKLNGGLGTSMGLRGAKSLCEVRPGATFLDLVARQVLSLRRTHAVRLPLVLMNSFRTREDSLAHLAAYPELDVGLPLDFVQHRVPKVRVDDGMPALWPTDPELAFCPPGHGDLYPALVTSGLLDALLAAGIRWLFVSNIDNLGATLDLSLLGWVRQTGASMVMEVATRTDADRKGGHLCRRRSDGRLILREIAQCPAADLDAFADVQRHVSFNTNNIWLDLDAIAPAMARGGGSLALPPIVNRKLLDPNDAGSPPVVQLESAMGAAIASLDGAAAVSVPRHRFAPVKTVADLILLRSDRYEVDERAELRACGDGPAPIIDVDEHYRSIDDLALRMPHGSPGLRAARRLLLRGDVRFGAGVVVRGAVELRAAPGEIVEIADGSCIEGAADASAFLRSFAGKTK